MKGTDVVLALRSSLSDWGQGQALGSGGGSGSQRGFRKCLWNSGHRREAAFSCPIYNWLRHLHFT